MFLSSILNHILTTTNTSHICGKVHPNPPPKHPIKQYISKVYTHETLQSSHQTSSPSSLSFHSLSFLIYHIFYDKISIQFHSINSKTVLTSPLIVARTLSPIHTTPTTLPLLCPSHLSSIPPHLLSLFLLLKSTTQNQRRQFTYRLLSTKVHGFSFIDIIWNLLSLLPSSNDVRNRFHRNLCTLLTCILLACTLLACTLLACTLLACTLFFCHSESVF